MSKNEEEVNDEDMAFVQIYAACMGGLIASGSTLTPAKMASKAMDYADGEARQGDGEEAGGRRRGRRRRLTYVAGVTAMSMFARSVMDVRD